MIKNLIKKAHAKWNYPEDKHFPNQISYALKHDIKFKNLPVFLDYIINGGEPAFKKHVKNLNDLISNEQSFKGFENNIFNLLTIYPDKRFSWVLKEKRKHLNKDKVSLESSKALLNQIDKWVNSGLYKKEKENIDGLFYNAIPYFSAEEIEHAGLNDNLKKIYYQYKTNPMNFFIDQENKLFFVDEDYIANENYREAIVHMVDSVKINKKGEDIRKDYFQPNYNILESDTLWGYKKNLELDYFIEIFNYFIEKHEMPKYFNEIIIEEDFESYVDYYEEDMKNKLLEKFYKITYRGQDNSSSKKLENRFYDFFKDLVDDQFLKPGHFYIHKNELGWGYSSQILDHVISNMSEISLNLNDSSSYKSLPKLLNPFYVIKKQKAFLNDEIKLDTLKKTRSSVL